MTKRAHRKYKKHRNDLYQTKDKSAVQCLIPFLPAGVKFCEPCAGEMHLVDQLCAAGHNCTAKYDIAPPDWAGYPKKNARQLKKEHLCGADKIITNPPYTRSVMHALIERFRKIAPTWLLLESDWAFTVQAAPYMIYCEKFVAVGRLSWMDNGVKGLDNYAWYLFIDERVRTEFYGKGEL